MMKNAADRGIHKRLGQAFPTAMVAALATAGLAGPATAQTVSSGDSPLDLTISGQVNSAFLYADDGNETDLFFVDNADNMSTRLRVEGTGRFDSEIFAGAVFEGQIATNPTTEITMGQTSSAGNGAFFARALEVYVDHSSYGRFSLGRGETASNGTSEVDLSGTEVVGNSQVADFAGGLDFFGPGGQDHR